MADSLGRSDGNPRQSGLQLVAVGSHLFRSIQPCFKRFVRPDRRKRPFLTRRSGGRPVPGQEVVEAVGRMTVGHALEDVLEVGVRLAVVELGGGDQ